MKKILSVILTVLIIASCLCLPAFATEVNYGYQFNDDTGVYMYINLPSNSGLPVWEFDMRCDTQDAFVSSFGGMFSMNRQGGGMFTFESGASMGGFNYFMEVGEWYHFRFNTLKTGKTSIHVNDVYVGRIDFPMNVLWCARCEHVTFDNLSYQCGAYTYFENFNDRVFDGQQDSNGAFVVIPEAAPDPRQAEDPTIFFDAVQTGKELTCTVSLKNNPGIWAMAGFVIYDTADVTYAGYDNGVIFQNSDITMTKGSFYYENDDLYSDVMGDGVLVKIHFLIKDPDSFDLESAIDYCPSAKISPDINNTINCNDEDVIFGLVKSYEKRDPYTPPIIPPIEDPVIRFDAVQSGSNLICTVNLLNNPGIWAMAGFVIYDNDQITYLGYENGEIFPEEDLTMNRGSFYYENEDLYSDIYGDGVLVRIYFRINDVANFNLTEDIGYCPNAKISPDVNSTINCHDDDIIFEVEPHYVIEELLGPSMIFKAVRTGDIVTTTVELHENPGIWSTEGFVDYNEDTVEYVSTANGEIFPNSYDLTVSHGNAYFFESNGYFNTTGDGVLVTQTYRITDPENFDFTRDIVFYPACPRSPFEWATYGVDDYEVFFDVLVSYEEGEAPVPQVTPKVIPTAVRNGNTVTYSLALENNPGLFSFYGNVQASYALTLTDTTLGSIFDDDDLTANGTRFLLTEDDLENREGDGTLITFTFEINNEEEFDLATAFTYIFEEDNDACALAYPDDPDGVYVNFEMGEYHAYNVTGTTATCTRSGVNVYTCVICGNTFEDGYTPALGHDYENAYTVDVRPAPGATGEKSYHCTRCDSRSSVTVIYYGDITGDNRTNSKDVLKLKMYLVGNTDLSDDVLVVADLNGDNRQNSADMRILKSFIVGIS